MKMRKWILGIIAILLMLVGFGGNDVIAQATSNKELKHIYSVYEEFLEQKKYEENWTREEYDRYYSDYWTLGVMYTRFACLDINQDGVPEMIVVGNNPTSDAPGYLYTYKKNKVVYVGKMDFDPEVNCNRDWGTFYYNPETKKLWLGACVNQEGEELVTYYTFNGNKLRGAKTRQINTCEETDPTGTCTIVKFTMNNKKDRKLFFGLTLSKKTITLSKTETFRLKANTNFTDQIKWTSSNKKVVEVNNNGKLTAKKTGVARITVKAGIYTASCNVKVVCYENHKWLKKYVYGTWEHIWGEWGEEDLIVKIKKHDWDFIDNVCIKNVYQDKSKNICVILKRLSYNSIVKMVLYKKDKYKKADFFISNLKEPYGIFRRLY